MALVNFKNEVLVRVYAVTLVVVVVAIAILARAFKVSIAEGDKWRQESAKKFMQYRDVPGERGNILAEDGSLLATSIPYFDLYWDAVPETLSKDEFDKGIDSLSMYIATYIDPQFTAAAWKDYLKQHREVYKSRYVKIAKGISYEQMMLAKDFPIFRNGRYKGGLIVLRDNKRAHPFKMLALRTLGYVKDDDASGQKLTIGLEGRFDQTLSGKSGKILMQRVGNDIWSPVEDLSDIEPRMGDDIVTTIDINTQDITQTALLRALNAHQAEHGTAIVMEVKTGKIKAIANIGRTEDGTLWEDFNYGIGRKIEPGSMFKLASLMSLLEDQAVKLSDTIDIENGSTKYFDEVLEDAERTNKRFVTVKEAFAHSSNVGVSKMMFQAYKDKPQAYVKHLKDFMLTVPTAIEIEGEDPPYVKNPDNITDNWSGTTLPWMSIGYEVQVTPLQLLTFFNAVANDGVMMKPYLVSETQRYGETKKTYKPFVIKQHIASKQTLDQAHELLEAVVDFGTAHHLRTSQYRFAGKTGTSQLNYGNLSKNKTNSRRNAGGYQTGFAGYFPAERPVYSCIIVIHKPLTGLSGGTVCAPVFREIADKLMSSNIALSEPINLKGKPIASAATLPNDVGYKDELIHALTGLKMKYEISNKEDPWTFLKAKNDTLNVLPRQMMTKKQVPSVVGMGLKDALYVLENRGLRVQFSGYGKVVSQSIGSGTAAAGQTISIRLD
jgi:cell division protein FtsI (penicillin-binding protein 3)